MTDQPPARSRTADGPVDRSGARTRAGYVTLVGLPNAGKSTLLNALVGHKLSIVTARAQTTWQRVTGIDTDPETGVQMIFLDTPGLLEARDLLQRAMLGAAAEALDEADVVLLVVDATESPRGAPAPRLEGALDGTEAPVLAAVNKVDLAPAPQVAEWSAWARDRAGAAAFPLSALDGTGVPALRAALREALPEGPFLYPEDDIASQPVRFFVAELVRETVFEHFDQEVPYSTFCRVEELREAQDPVYVGVTVFVERESQKGILVGRGGHAIRALGVEARAKIEHFLGRPVYLDLWVKALTGWRRKRAHLGRLGFHVPGDVDGE